MKKLVHKGWLYVASVALALLGLVGVSYTASAQTLWVLGTKVSDPLVNDYAMEQSGYSPSDETWNGYWKWNPTTKTLLLRNIDSYKPVQGIYVEDIPSFNIKVEGECWFRTSAKNKSVIESNKCSMTIEGVGEGATLFVRTKRGGSHGIRIAQSRNLNIINCLVDVSSDNLGITGEGDGSRVGITLSQGARIEAYGKSGAITDIKDYIQVFEDGKWKDLNESAYARVTIDDEDVEYLNGNIVYKGSGSTVKGKWVMLAPYYPVSIGGVKLHRYRKELTPSNFSSIITSGKVEYDYKDHKLMLSDAVVTGTIYSGHTSKFLTIECKGANKITTTTGTAIYAEDKSSPTILGKGTNPSLELYPGTSDNYPGIWDATQNSWVCIKDIDLKISSKSSCIYTNQSDKEVTLINLNATLTTVSDWSLITGFKTLEIQDAYIASPIGAVVDGGRIMLNGSALSNTTCEIKRGKAPTYSITYDPQIQHGSVKVTNYSGSLSSVPLNTKLKVEATPHTGYHVTKITAGGENITSSKEFVVTRNAEISAQFEVNKYNVTSSSSTGGSISLSHSGQVAYGTEVTVTVNPNEGYKLTALKAGSKDILSTKKFTVEGATEVKATFEKQTFAVTAKTPENGTITLKGFSDMKKVPYGTTIKVEAKPKNGYELSKLTVNGVDITAKKEFVVKKASEVEATFKLAEALEEVTTTEVLLYPNPAAEATTLSGVEPGVMVQILSLDGVEVLRTEANEVGVARLDLADVAAGKYLVKSGKTTVVLLVTK